jgi:hypothetical protein
VIGTTGLEVVPADLRALLPATADDWRDNSLLGMKPLRFNHLEVRMAAPLGFALDQDSNQVWHLTKPMTARADNDKVNHLLQQLRNTVLTSFVPDTGQTNLDVFGLQPPRIELALGLGTNDALVLRFGLSPTNAPQEVLGWQNLHGQVFRVDKAITNTLSVPYTELRDHRLLSLPLDTVNCVEFQADESVVLQQRTNGQWMITAPVRMPADEEVVRGFFHQLNHLEVFEFTKDVVTDFAEFGLAPPARQLHLKQLPRDRASDTTNLFVLQLDFSTNQTDRLWARRHDEKSVYALKLSDFRQLPQNAAQWLDRKVWSFAAMDVRGFSIQSRGQYQRVKRGAAGQWEIAAPSLPLPDPVPMMLEELMHRLGSMRVSAWVDRGETNLDRYGLGKDHRQTWELQLASQPVPLTLDVGEDNPSSASRYASVILYEQRLIFELPSPVSSLLVEVLRALPPAPAPTPAAANPSS